MSKSKSSRLLFPLPKGAGQGEGKGRRQAFNRLGLAGETRKTVFEPGPIQPSNASSNLCDRFPLTPVEDENCLSAFDKSERSESSATIGKSKSARLLFPLPKGEGQGE